MNQRYIEAMRATTYLLKKGIWVFSPIVHCHPMDLPRDYEFWQAYNKAMLSEADGLYVLIIEGWEKSRGVTDEISFARNRKPIHYVIPIGETNDYILVNEDTYSEAFRGNRWPPGLSERSLRDYRIKSERGGGGSD